MKPPTRIQTQSIITFVGGDSWTCLLLMSAANKLLLTAWSASRLPVRLPVEWTDRIVWRYQCAVSLVNSVHIIMLVFYTAERLQEQFPPSPSPSIERALSCLQHCLRNVCIDERPGPVLIQRPFTFSMTVRVRVDRRC